MIGPTTPSLLCPMTIGRARELAAIRRQIEGANGGVLLISGEAGIGKTRLAREAAAYAVRLGHCVLQGTCFEPDRALPYAPILDLLRSLLDHRSRDDVTRLVGPGAADLARLLPGLAVPATDGGARDNAPEAEKRRLFEALVHLFHNLGSERPLLVLVEDLHWSDDISLEFLLYLARRVANRPLLLVLSYRPEELHPVLRHLLAELDRGRLAGELALQPLTVDQVAQMLRAIFGQSRSLPVDVVQGLSALTEGNPFFIEEVLNSLVAAGGGFHLPGAWTSAGPSDLSIPRSVADAVQRRVEQLSRPARQALTMAAVTGRRFDFPVLREVTGQDTRELVQCLKELVAAQLVVEESGEQFAFRHALTRQAVYTNLLTIERTALHGTIAETMERVYADARDEHAGDLAYHFHEAGIWPNALAYAAAAGERAMALYAPRAAIEHFTRALAAAAHLPEAPRLTLYRARGRAFEILGDFARAREDLEQALALAQATGDERAAWQPLLDLGLLWTSRDYARAGEYIRVALDLARTLDDPATLGHSLNRMGNWYVNFEQPQEGLRCHEEALAIFAELGNDRGIAETQDLIGMARCCGGDLHGSMESYERAAALFRRLDDRLGLVMSLALLGARAGEYHFDPLVPDSAEFAWAVAAGEEALAIAREIQWRAGEAFAGGQFAQCLGTWGDYGRALALAHGAERIAAEIEHDQWRAFSHQVLGWLYLDLLALPIARDHLEQALRLARQANSRVWSYATSGILASACVQNGDLARAEEVLAAVPGPADLAHTFGQWLIARAHVELALARRQPARALDLLDGLLASLATANGDRQRTTGPPHLGRLRGEALAALGRVAEAEALFQRDLAAAHERKCLPLAWRLHAALGHLYRSDARRAAADREFAAARTIIEALAAKVPDDGLRATFQQQALAMLPPPRPRTALRADKEAFGGLTRRERDVAALITKHKTNRQIAQALFVSERTVAAHVSHILAKLNLASRSEIALWAHEHGLTPRADPLVPGRR